MLYSTGIDLLAEHVLTDDDLFYASSWSYLRWLEEEWGFARADRMFVAPIFSMRDVDRTCEQLDYFFERGGKVVAMVPGPAYGRSPGDPYFDRIWGRINDAHATVSYHINEAPPGYKAGRSREWGEQENPTFFTQSAWQWYWAYGDVPAQETFSSLIYAQSVQPVPEPEHRLRRARLRVDSAVRAQARQDARHGTQRTVDRRAVARAAEQDLQASLPGRAVLGGRHGRRHRQGRPRGSARRLGLPAFGGPGLPQSARRPPRHARRGRTKLVMRDNGMALVGR